MRGNFETGPGRRHTAPVDILVKRKDLLGYEMGLECEKCGAMFVQTDTPRYVRRCFCGGHLVWAGDSCATPPSDFKIRSEYRAVSGKGSGK